MKTEDAHLDKPELGDWVEFKETFRFGETVKIEGEITRAYNSTRKADIRADDGRMFRKVLWKDIFVLSKAA